jgi:hypothetical protein
MLLLRFVPNGRWHEDLILEFAGHTFVCDSYYFSLYATQHDPIAGTKRVLRDSLGQWYDLVASLHGNAPIYLPYDLSDQCTGWLRCMLVGDEVVQVCQGASRLEGHRVALTDLKRHAAEVSDFTACGPGGACSRCITY